MKPHATIVGVGVLLLAMGAAAQAQAEDEPEDLLPLPKSGLISVLGGARYTIGGSFLHTSDQAGYPLKSHTVGPQVFVPFGYRVDESWAALIDFGYGVDRFSFAPYADNAASDLRIQTFTIQLAGQWTPQLGWRRVEPVFGIGLGYYLSTLTSSDPGLSLNATESNATGFFASAGLRVALTAKIGLLVEDRYAFATAAAGKLGNVPVGGNTASLGLYYVWRE